MYKIGELSRLCMVSVTTLRYWADIGLLVPDMVDRFTGYRYYGAARLSDCHRIIVLKELGFTLDEIKQHIAAHDRDNVSVMIRAKMTELESSISKIEQQKRRLESMLQIITEGEQKMFNMVIQNAGEIRVAFIRRIFANKSEAYAQIQNMRENLPQKVQGSRSVIINYETEYRERDFDLAVCVEVCGVQDVYEEQTIVFDDEVASLICRREELDEAYRDISGQLRGMNCQMVGAFREVYHDDDNVELKVPVCRLSQPCEVADDVIEPFENDPDAIGMWEFVDLVPSAEQFAPGHVKYGDHASITQKKLCFLPNGGNYWIVNGWTRGKLYTSSGYPKYLYAHEYTIEDREGETYMFLAKWDSYHKRRGGRPQIHVYRKIDSREHTADDMRIRDIVDMPFVMDARILGNWKAYDCISQRENYSPKERFLSEEALLCKSIDFFSDGKATQTRTNGVYMMEWTKGALIERERQIACAYEICEIDDREFLIVEWKSGDYEYGGMVRWYVYTRA